MTTRLLAGALSVAPLLGWALPGCLQVTTGTNDPAGPTPVADAAASGDGGGPTGAGCGPDPQTGTVLCIGISACPSMAVDPSAWPGCGFRVLGGTALDLECVCGSALCPIGVATTCEQASQLLSTQNVLAVCQQASEGRCVGLSPADSGAPSTCDRNCQIGCGAAPDCLQICGC